MPEIKLSDGKKVSFSKAIDGFEIANKISKSLAKDACIMSVDGKLEDLSFLINKNVEVKIITAKDKEGLEVIRHDAAHVLAMAVQELFPGTQVTIGPVIEDGFYYDFSRKEAFTGNDLKKIENKMKEIVDRDELTKREVLKRDEAIEVHICLRQEKSVKRLNLQKFRERIGEVIQIMKCYKEYMALVGLAKKN